jgi:biopolymer transport protein ExbD
MQLQTRAKRKPLINITSLIDVLFLLLLFVLVSSSFIEKPGIKVDLPGAANADPLSTEGHTLYVDQEGGIYLNEQRLTEADLEEALKKVLPTMKDGALTLNADEAVSHGLVVRLMDISKKSGIKKLIIGTQKKGA